MFETKKNTWFVILLFSAVMHVGGLSLLVIHQGGTLGDLFDGNANKGKKKGKKGAGGNGEESKRVSVTLIPKTPKNVKGIKKACKDWYGGVGLRHEGATVTEVPVGYPAHKAGVKPGDLLFDIESLRGEPGTKTVIKFMRGTKLFKKEVIRDRICQKKDKP